MRSARSVASLKPALLARKGGARPAMRSGQPYDLGALTQAQDDLGWNDFGSDPVPLRPAPTAASERRYAFTVRLDSRRHLKLRLASTVRHCSAQVLLTEALDRFLETIPQLEALTDKARLPTDHS